MKSYKEITINGNGYVNCPTDDLVSVDSGAEWKKPFGLVESSESRDDVLKVPAEKVLTFKEAPTHYPFDIYAAYRIRVTSFANGAIYAINHSELNDEEKRQKINAITDLLELKLKDLKNFKKDMDNNKGVNFSSELYQFYNKDLPAASGLKPKQIALAEAMYAWQEVPRPARKTQYTRKLANGDFLLIEQIDEPRSAELTQNQKDDLTLIFTGPVPEWFTKLDVFAQNALKKILNPDELVIIPELNVDQLKWGNYQKCHPTILRHIPGEANGTTHSLKVTHLDPYGKVISVLYDTTAVRQGTPTSFNMPKSARQNSANENIKQMLSDAEITHAKDRFKAAWKLTDAEMKNNPMPILFGGLLTPREQSKFNATYVADLFGLTGAESNTLLAHEKDKAIDEWKKNNIPGIQIFNLNVGVNGDRGSPVKPDEEFIKFVRDFHGRMNSKCQTMTDEKSRGELKRNVQQLEYGLRALEELKTAKPVDGRNQNLYTASLYDDVTRLMQGEDTGHCKSSKDRKGAEFIMSDAMIIYLAEQEALNNRTPSFPRFDAEKKEYDNLVEIFCQHYASGHQLLVAHDNSSGCPGIKDEGILDKAFIDELQMMQKRGRPETKADKNDPDGGYAQSKEIANFNKPGTFWKKYRNKIIKGTMIGGAVILGTVSAICLATGVLSPVGVIGATAAANLGAAAVSVGWAANIGISMVGGGLLAWLSGKARNKYEAFKDRKNTFQAQLTAYRENNKNKKTDVSAPSKPLVSTKMSPDENLEKKPNVAIKNNNRLEKLTESKIDNAIKEYLDGQGNLQDSDYYNIDGQEFLRTDEDRSEFSYIKRFLKATIVHDVKEQVAPQQIAFYANGLSSQDAATIVDMLDSMLDLKLKQNYPRFNSNSTNNVPS